MAMLVNMDLSQVYSLGLGGVILFILTFRLCHAVSSWLLPQGAHWVRVLSIPRPRGRLRWVLPKTWIRFLLLVLYIGGTVASNTIRVSTLSEASSRAAKICLVNLVPLMVCSHELGTRYLGTSVDLYHSVHRALGTMAFFQCLAHGFFELISQSVDLHEVSMVFGLTGLIVFVSLMVCSIFKRHLYELFTRLHHICALGLVFAAWRHVGNKSPPSTWYITGAASMYVVTALVRLLRLVFRNLTFGRRGECLIREQGNCLEIIVFPARPWTVQAGERVTLNVPSAGLLSLFQMHPFVIAWWDNNELGALESITLLVRPRSGFTKKLARMSKNIRFTAWIDGPFGPERSGLSDYGHLFMVATGIGVAAQIPYIKQLIDGYQEGIVRTRRIRLIWQLVVGQDYENAVAWLQRLVKQDTGCILEVHIFDPDKSSDLVKDLSPDETSLHPKPRNIGQHKLIKIWDGYVDWQDALSTEHRRQVGTMLIAVSAQSSVRDTFRRLARKYRKDKVELLELEFQPWEWKRSIWSYF